MRSTRSRIGQTTRRAKASAPRSRPAVSQSVDIDQMLRRRYVQMFKFGHFDTNFDVLFEASPDFFSHGAMAREIAQQAIVLLKNENNVLPLSAANLQSVALIGAPWFAGIAKLPVRGGDDNTPFNEPGNPPYSVAPQDGLENVLRSVGSSATSPTRAVAGQDRGRTSTRLSHWRGSRTS